VAGHSTLSVVSFLLQAVFPALSRPPGTKPAPLRVVLTLFLGRSPYDQSSRLDAPEQFWLLAHSQIEQPETTAALLFGKKNMGLGRRTRVAQQRYLNPKTVRVFAPNQARRLGRTKHHDRILGVPDISVTDRNRFVADYNKAWPRTKRVFWGSVFRSWHWLARWWKIKPQVGLLQVLYIVALITTALLSIIPLFQKAAPMEAPATIARLPTTSESRDYYALPISERAWLEKNLNNVILSVCIGVVLAYKTMTIKFAMPHEAERRRGMASLLSRLAVPGIVDYSKLGGQTEARLMEICGCIRRDVEEFLEIGEADIEVLLLRFVPGAGKHDGKLVELARDRPTGMGFFAGATNRERACLESFIWEPIRLERTVVFHDLKSRYFRRFLGRVAADYRAVVGIPLARSGESVPYGVLTLKIGFPYLLWPTRDAKLERRLAMYVQIVNVFTPKE
jgi:hypothetical protein